MGIFLASAIGHGLQSEVDGGVFCDIVSGCVEECYDAAQRGCPHTKVGRRPMMSSEDRER